MSQVELPASLVSPALHHPIQSRPNPRSPSPIASGSTPPSKKLKFEAASTLDDATQVAEVVDEHAMMMEEMSLPLMYERAYSYELDYRNKLVLAPMVRSGALPTRLLSLYYGAGLVWSPEVVDKAIIGSTRTVDPETGVITYSKGQGPIFTTHPIEKPYLIFQIGSSDPELALEAAKTVQQDVSGIDLNCGCPKPFSTHAGMGAALLSTPDLLVDILRNLIENISLPISCKIRLLPTQASTLHLVARLLRTGIRNLTVHCRTRTMRPAEKALWHRLREIVDLGRRRGIPVICNGDGEGWGNWESIRDLTGADSIMLARAAEQNPSIFSRRGPHLIATEVVPKLLNIAEHTSNPWGNTKFLLMQYKPTKGQMDKTQRKKFMQAIGESKSLEEASGKLSIPLGRGVQFFTELRTILDAGEETLLAPHDSRNPRTANHSAPRPAPASVNEEEVLNTM